MFKLVYKYVSHYLHKLWLFFKMKIIPIYFLSLVLRQAQITWLTMACTESEDGSPHWVTRKPIMWWAESFEILISKIVAILIENNKYSVS